MNLTLHRLEEIEAGVFGILVDSFGNQICVTCEHAYDSGRGNGSFEAKIPAGEYTCKRGPHRLASMTQSFTTFEVENVPGHTNILFHPGNTEKDSEGCILLGTSRQGDAIVESRDAFNKFMSLQSNTDSFTLTVE